MYNSGLTWARTTVSNIYSNTLMNKTILMSFLGPSQPRIFRERFCWTKRPQIKFWGPSQPRIFRARLCRTKRLEVRFKTHRSLEYFKAHHSPEYLRARFCRTKWPQSPFSRPLRIDRRWIFQPRPSKKNSVFWSKKMLFEIVCKSIEIPVFYQQLW
jgi:hypothetical protein